MLRYSCYTLQKTNNKGADKTARIRSLVCAFVVHIRQQRMTFNIKVGNSVSEQVRQHIGLRQGDNLSPNLFKLFLIDLSKCFDASDDHVELGSIHSSCLLYAVDLVLLSTSET